MIFVCVNYKSHSVLDLTLKKWKEFCLDLDIYVVDNYYSDNERKMVGLVCEKYGAILIENLNSGYGAGLNAGLSAVLKDNYSESNSNDRKIFFGNADIAPIEKIVNNNLNQINVLNIYNKGRAQNPFLTITQNKFINICVLAASYRSKYLMYIWIVLKNILGIFPTEIAAVHGSLFCLTLSDVRKIHPIFDEDVFLYCEELFFMEKVKQLGKKYLKVNYKFDHIGSVSTGEAIKNNKSRYFENWTRSMNIYSKKYLK